MRAGPEVLLRNSRRRPQTEGVDYARTLSRQAHLFAQTRGVPRVGQDPLLSVVQCHHVRDRINDRIRSASMVPPTATTSRISHNTTSVIETPFVQPGSVDEVIPRPAHFPALQVNALGSPSKAAVDDFLTAPGRFFTYFERGGGRGGGSRRRGCIAGVLTRGLGTTAGSIGVWNS